MLASSFMTAEQLEIEPAHRDALIEVLHRLESGELRHCIPDRYNDNPPNTMLFNMQHWDAYCDCGTAHCIGGSAEAIGQFLFDRKNDGSMKNRDLQRLFYPQNIKMEWQDIPVERAAKTLRRYLQTGKVSWAR